MAVITSIEPNSGDLDDKFTVTISGDVFHGATGVSFGAQVEIISWTIKGDGIIEVKIYIPQDANSGPRDVTVFGSPDGVLPGAFTVR